MTEEQRLQAESGIERRWLERRALFLNEVAFDAGYWKEQAIHAERGALDFALEGMRSAYILHGGAVFVMVAATDLLRLGGKEALALTIPFFAGLAATLLCNLCAYFAQIRLTYSHTADYWLSYSEASQQFYPDHQPEHFKKLIATQEKESKDQAKVGNRWRNSAIAFGVFSILLFVIGGILVIAAVSGIESE